MFFINLFKTWWKRINAFWSDGRYVLSGLYILALPAGIFAACWLFWWVASMLIKLFSAHGEEILLFFGVPALIIWWLTSRKKDNASTPAPAPTPGEDLSMVEQRAKNTYSVMAQTTFLLFEDLVRYVPGLVKPFTPASVEAPSHYTITANFATIYHFIIGKGTDDTPPTVVREILETIISQHLNAGDLPISLPGIYTAADGSTWPSLVVDGVYDLGLNYRIDLAITCEAVVARLKVKNATKLAESNGVHVVRDEDFS